MWFVDGARAVWVSIDAAHSQDRFYFLGVARAAQRRPQHAAHADLQVGGIVHNRSLGVSKGIEPIFTYAQARSAPAPLPLRSRSAPAPLPLRLRTRPRNERARGPHVGAALGCLLGCWGVCAGNTAVVPNCPSIEHHPPDPPRAYFCHNPVHPPPSGSTGKLFRTTPAAFPHSSRSFSAQLPHSSRTAPAQLPQLFRTAPAQLPLSSRTAIPQLCAPLWGAVPARGRAREHAPP